MAHELECVKLSTNLGVVHITPEHFISIFNDNDPLLGIHEAVENFNEYQRALELSSRAEVVFNAELDLDGD